MKSDASSCVKNKKSELQIPPSFSHPYTWPLAAGSGHECWDCGFWTQPAVLTSKAVGGGAFGSIILRASHLKHSDKTGKIENKMQANVAVSPLEI